MPQASNPLSSITMPNQAQQASQKKAPINIEAALTNTIKIYKLLSVLHLLHFFTDLILDLCRQLGIVM